MIRSLHNVLKAVLASVGIRHALPAALAPLFWTMPEHIAEDEPDD
jgi:hypothetical protein